MTADVAELSTAGSAGETPQQSAEHQQALQLLSMFDPLEPVLFRPIESWIEFGKKKSRTVFKSSRCWRPENINLHRFQDFLGVAAREKANLFFGVCPRFGLSGFDLSWQIRRVVCLWADIDHCTAEVAIERCKEAKLPHPSLIVNSGNGVHLYWFLSIPYVIDDVDKPPQVHKHFVEVGGRKKCIQSFIGSDGDRVYLDDPKTGKAIRSAHPKLSAKAMLVQDILKGLAAQIGGDHTTDLARLLRLPGTMNRKDERNGAEPVPCQIVEFSGTRYDIAVFSHLVQVSPDKKRREQIAKVALPTERKVTPSRRDALNRLILICGTATDRSQADFALVSHAIEKGVPKETLWPMVEAVGKFAERGREYFDRTWNNASEHTQEQLLDGAIERGRSKQADVIHPVTDGDPGGDQPNTDVDGTGDIESPHFTGSDDYDRPQITIMPEFITVLSVMARITEEMLAAGLYYRRAGIPVTIRGSEIVPIDTTGQLSGIVNSFAEVLVVKTVGGSDGFTEKREYKPLPTEYATTWLNHPRELGRLPEMKLFTRNPVFDGDFNLVAPGYSKAFGIYFTGPAVEVRSGTEHIDILLQDFCFRTVADRTNYIGMMVTCVLVNHFIGSKPGIVFNGNQPSLGKTILAQLLAILRDGHCVETCTYIDKDEEFEKRIASRVRAGATTLIVDNAKSRLYGKTTLIESSCLERAITDEILSFRLLGHNLEIRAENSHIIAITVNTAELSRDLVTRCVPVELYLEGDPTRRRFKMPNPEGYAEENRAAILGELLGMVERWKAAGMPQVNVNSRFNKRNWGNIIGGILHVNGEPDFLSNADQAAHDFDPVRRDFEDLVQVLMDNRETQRWASMAIARIATANHLLIDEIGDKSDRSRATRMGTLLGRFLGETFHVTGRCGTLEGQRSVKLRADDVRNGREYWFQNVDGPTEG